MWLTAGSTPATPTNNLILNKMKKVIFEVEVEAIDTLNDGSFVGILWKDGEKAMVVQRPDNRFTFFQNSTTSITESTTTEDSLVKLLKYTKRVDEGYKEAFVFETLKGLLTWLAK